MNPPLFVYGTLHPDRAPDVVKDVVRRMIPIGRGTIPGNLHDLGEYPALTLDGRKKQLVQGSIFALPDDPEILEELDRYEGYLPDDPVNSLFVRSRRLVTLEDGPRRFCWVYVYNQELPSNLTG